MNFPRRREPSLGGSIARSACLLLALSSLGACAFSSEDSEVGAATETSALGSARPERLKVMTFNIFYGGDDLDLKTGGFCELPDGCQATFAQVVRAIRKADADVIGVQEPERNVARLGQELGFYFSERDHVVSRFPIIDPPDGDGVFVYVEVEPGKVVAIANVHLPSDPYGPYLVRDGGTKKQLSELERSTRLPAIRAQLAAVPKLARRGIPVFLTGDMNSPSHLDWTPAVARVRRDVKFPFLWPVSAALADAGLRDSYREVHPDPVRVPGFTWTPGSPEAGNPEVFDRIDWVLSAGPTRALDSQIVGEVGGPDVGIGISPFPSDHRGVVSTFEVRAAEPPVLVAVSSRRVPVADDLQVTFHAPGHEGEHLALVRLRDDGTGSTVAEQPTGKRSPTNGQVRFSTRGLRPGQYEARLLDCSGEALSRTPFWLYARGEPTTLRSAAARYRVGEPIRAQLTNAPGRGLDWVALYRCDKAGCAGNGDYLLYAYSKALVEGTVTIDASSIAGAESWPLAPGRYVMRLLTDDSYQDVATSQEFSISAR